MAIEPVSDFILAEKYAPHRDAETWNQALKQALEGLPVKIIQSTGDEAKGILAHVRDGLGAHHSPDLFHGQHELHKATILRLQTCRPVWLVGESSGSTGAPSGKAVKKGPKSCLMATMAETTIKARMTKVESPPPASHSTAR